ncbi:hypothetical protein AcV7_007192 [Taiwanofungus camphoratus]|nr:hypothetical protein AcV7_007192 [Antrodia cinnamomea]
MNARARVCPRLRLSVMGVLLAVLALAPLVHALPTPPPPPPSASPLLALLPLPLLAILKYLFLTYRRIHSLRAAYHVPVSAPALPAVRAHRVRIFETAYLVGLLGSPHWETRPAPRAHKSTHRPPSACLQAPLRLNNTSAATSRSRTASASYLDIHSPQPHLDITSCAIVHPRSPACVSAPLRPPAPALQFLPTPHAPSTAPPSPEPLSPTLMQIMEPVLSSWYDDTKLDFAAEPSQDSSSSDAHHSRQRNPSRSRSRDGKTSHSPTPPFETPPTSPSSDSAFSHKVHVQIQTQTQTPHISLNAFRKQLALSTASSTAPQLGRSGTGAHSPTLVACDAAPARLPPAHTCPSRSTSASASADTLIRRAQEPEREGAWLQAPTHRSPPPEPFADGHPHARLLGLTATVYRVPLAPTTRPLNVGVAPKPLPAPPSPQPLFTSAGAIAKDPVQSPLLRLDAHSPLELISDKPRHPNVGARVVRAQAPQRRRSGSGSPTIGPSPLRNSVLVEVGGGAEDGRMKEGGSARGSWELEDLVRNGRLDVDAVSAVLGLGLGLSLELADAPQLSTSRSLSPTRLVLEDSPDRSEWRLEEDGGSSTVPAGGAKDVGTGMGWGRACEHGATTLQVRVREPGAQLCAIPEEADECDAVDDEAFARESDGRGIRGVAVGEPEVGTVEERSWRDGLSVRENVVGMAC